MDAIDERFAVYTVVLFLCSEIALMAGVAAGAATFAALAAGIELCDGGRRSSGRRRH
jgi:hypothetical protein